MDDFDDTSLTDAELVRRSWHDPAAFAGIYDRHAATLFGYCTRRLGRPDAEDVLGECFRIAFETRRRFDCARPSALPWLYGIAGNLIARHQRGSMRRGRALGRLQVVSDTRVVVPFDETVTDHAANLELLDAVRRLVDALPAGEREVLVLYAWEHLSYGDIAEALDLPIGTVRSRLNRIRTALRELRERFGQEQGVPSQRAPGGV